MSNYLVYLLQVSCIFSCFTIFYVLVLKKLTFHSFNRLVLLLAIPVSLVIPALEFNLDRLLPTRSLEAEIMGTPLEQIQSFEPAVAHSVGSPDWYFWIELLYWAGLGVGIFMLGLSLIKVFKVKRASQTVSRDSYILHKADIRSSFSCFHWIFVPKNSLSSASDPIIRHEIAHIRMFHTLDLLLTELFIALTWFNPFVFLFRKLLKSVHEFQADQFVLRNNVSKSDYLSLMLQNLLTTEPISISSSFSGLTIKNRIEMITKHKSSSNQILRYGFIIPILAVFFLAFATFSGTKPSIWPIADQQYHKVTSSYGKRMNPITKEITLHTGIDIIAPTGTEVVATGSGQVTKAKMEGKWGNLVIIDHGGGYKTWYAHMKDFTVEAGQKVKAGELVGHVGNTGMSTGPHLHYEVRLNEESVDPEDYFDERTE